MERNNKYYISRYSVDRAQQYTARFNEAVRKAGGIVNYFKGVAAFARKEEERPADHGKDKGT